MMERLKNIVKHSGILFLLIAIHGLLNGESLANHLDDSIYIRTDKYEGIVFNGNSPSQLIISDSLRWEITEADIAIAEAMIYKYLEKNWHKKKFKRNQGGHCPAIFPNLTNYYRQYYGTIESNGHKIINITCFWKSKEEDQGWKSYLVIVNGGCSYYWEIKIDMDKKKCYDYIVNGPD